MDRTHPGQSPEAHGQRFLGRNRDEPHRSAPAMIEPIAPDNDVFTVVLADDDGRVRDALANLLDDQPRLLVVGAADSGSAAAALCSEFHPDLAVVDVVMDTGGVQAVEAIHRVSPDTIVVVYTARRDRRTRQRLLACGAAEVFAKGSLIDLSGVIEELASDRRRS